MRKILLPIAIVIAGFALAAGIVATGPRLEQQPPPPDAPLVRSWLAASQTVQMTAIAHGTVSPRTESELIPEVSGRVVELSPSMVSGGFFKANEVLFRVDPLDYELALEQARAALASAESELINARKGHIRQTDLARRQSTSASQQDDALNRLKVGEANIREVKARIEKATRDLARTEVRAPYEGRVRSERVDVGQFVSRGISVANLYATDYAEVRLPIQDSELAYLDLPLGNGGSMDRNEPVAELRASFGGNLHTWVGKIVRTEGELDPQTRMLHVIAQVQSPYLQIQNKPPLAVGLFVEAEIIGRHVDNVFVIPRSALQSGNQVYVINQDNRLEFRNVNILRFVDEHIYITSGFEQGETICISTLTNAIEGMSVRPTVPDQSQGVAAS